MSNVEAIKKALESVAVREWTFDGPDDNIIIWCGTDIRVCFMTSDGPSHEHAQFITACSPTAITELLTTLEALQRENEALKRHVEELQEKINPEKDCACSYDEAGAVCGAHSPMLKAAEAEVKRLRERLGDLENYADEKTAVAFRYMMDAERVGDLPFKEIMTKERDAYSDMTMQLRSALASAGEEHHADK